MAAVASASAAKASLALSAAIARFAYARHVGVAAMLAVYASRAPAKSPALNRALPRSRHSSDEPASSSNAMVSNEHACLARASQIAKTHDRVIRSPSNGG